MTVKLNSSFSENVAIFYIHFGEHDISASGMVHNTGAYYDYQIKMDNHVKMMFKSAWHHIYSIWKIHDLLTLDQAKSVVHAYVTSKLNSYNALLAGAAQTLITKLQRIQNTTAKIITCSRKYDHVTPLLYELHCLHAPQQIIFKVLLQLQHYLWSPRQN